MHKPIAIALLALSVLLAHFPFRAAHESTSGEPLSPASPTAEAGHIDFTYDDVDFVENNASILSFDTARKAAFAAFPPEQPERGLYRPLVNFSYAVDFALFGYNARAYHGVNTALYLALVWLVYALALRWFDDPRVAFAAALVFAVHPVHCDAVDSISGRSELLALSFGVASWLVFDRATRQRERSLGLAAVSALLYACASLSKETGVLLPAVLVLHLLARDGAPTGFSAFFRKALDATSLHLAIAFFYLALRMHVLGGFGPGAPVLAGIDSATRAFTMGAVYAEYLRLLIFPDILQLDFYYQQVVGLPSEISGRIAFGWVAMLGLFGAFAAATLATLRGDQRMSPQLRRALVAGLGTFFVFLAPVSHLLDIGALMAERFLFAPSLGFTFGIVGLVSLALERGVSLVGRRRVVDLVSAALLVVISVAGVTRSAARAAEWRDGVKLWESAAQHTPDDYRSYTNIATHWIDRGDVDAAEVALRRALELKPDDRAVNLNLSVVLMNRGALDEAAAIHEAMLRADPSDFMAWYNLGNVALRRDELSEAIGAFEKTLAANPNFAPAHADIAAAQERIDHAKGFLLNETANARTSSNPDFLDLYARACRMTGDYECARKYEARAATARN